jgi:hypothetical protein
MRCLRGLNAVAWFANFVGMGFGVPQIRLTRHMQRRPRR